MQIDLWTLLSKLYILGSLKAIPASLNPLLYTNDCLQRLQNWQLAFGHVELFSAGKQTGNREPYRCNRACCEIGCYIGIIHALEDSL